MKNRKIRLLAWLLTLCATVATVASCGDGGGSTSDVTTAPQNGEVTETTADSGYDYGDYDFKGYNFRVMNLLYQFNDWAIRIDHEEQSGEALDDATYIRNRKVEEKLNIKFTEKIVDGGSGWGTAQHAANNAIMNSVLSGTDDYDAGFAPIRFDIALISDGYVMNLLDIPELDVYGEHWDANINRELTMDNNLSVASTPIHSMSFDLSWAIMFNEDMMNSLGLDKPYDLVRDGTWTLDEFAKYVNPVASLNGDESFTPDANGNAFYSIAGHTTAPLAFGYAADVRLYETDDSGKIELTLGGERIHNAYDKIASILTINDGHIFYNNGSLTEPLGYGSMFSNNRALFITCEVKTATTLRDMEATFGLVPMPKLDESQDSYYSRVDYNTSLLVIPVTVNNPNRAGVILDALTYESYVSTLPVYYDITMSQKGLRNDDSIEMLNIIRDARGIDALELYMITSTLNTAIQNLITAGSGDASGIASAIDAQRPTVEAKLDEILEIINK